MKLGLVTKLDKSSKKIDDNLISKDCDIIAISFKLWPMWSNPEFGLWTHSL